MNSSTNILSAPKNAVPNTSARIPGEYVELPITTAPFDGVAIVCPPTRNGVGVFGNGRIGGAVYNLRCQW